MFRVNSDDCLSIDHLTNELSTHFSRTRRPIVIVCIGTDRCTGDSLGPLVGTFLSRNSSILVYGTLEKPIHGSNLDEKMAMIKKKHPFSYIVAIDACLGKLRSVGDITIRKGSIKPGSGVDKDLTPVGELSIEGIVNVSSPFGLLVLQSTRLNQVFKMAQTISDAIEKSYFAEKKTLFSQIKHTLKK